MRPTRNDVKAEPTTYGGLIGPWPRHLEFFRRSTGVFSPALFFTAVADTITVSHQFPKKRKYHESLTPRPAAFPQNFELNLDLIQ
jgi:hypothetical protein